MPQLLQPYNPWFIGIEAAVAAAVVGGAVEAPPSMGAVVGIAVVIGAWNYWVQKEYPVPRKLIEKAEVLKYTQYYNRDLTMIEKAGVAPVVATVDAANMALGQVSKWEAGVHKNAALQF